MQTKYRLTFLHLKEFETLPDGVYIVFEIEYVLLYKKKKSLDKIHELFLYSEHNDIFLGLLVNLF